jgi:hypothetical protein
MTMKRASKAVLLLLFACVVIFPVSARADDDVLDSIRNAEKLYREKNYTEAARELEFAAQLVRQKKGERLKEIFPDPLPGWKAGEPEITSAGAPYLGGGIQATRDYMKGNSSVTVEFAMENPILQLILGVMDNPMVVGPGAKLVRIKKQRAVLRFDGSSREGEITLVYRRRVMVTVKGTGLSSPEILRSYMEGIDFNGLEKIVFQ